MKILVVEDDKKLSRVLQLELEHENYKVAVAYDGKTGLKMAQENGVDLVLLDIMLPELSGIGVLKKLRKLSSVPVIMLTAKDDVSDKVMGLDSGADDYMTKPFDIEELLARIRVAMSRQAKQTKEDAQIEFGKLSINTDTFKATYAGEDLGLTKKEYELLCYLAKNRGKVLSRDKILKNVWGYDYAGETNVVDVYILYLRNKINKPFDIDMIKTVRGFGYTLGEQE